MYVLESNVIEKGRENCFFFLGRTRREEQCTKKGNRNEPCKTDVPILAFSLILATGVMAMNSGGWSSTSCTFTRIAVVPVFT